MSSNSVQRLLSVFVVSLALLVTVGCGSSNNDFVAFNNNGGQNVNAGNLVFRFQRAVAQTIVAPATTTIRFDFHSANPPTDTSLVFSEDRLFAERIVFTDVPSNVVFVNVTALDANGGLIARFSVPVTVSSNAETEVDLGTAAPITLDSIQVTPDPAVIVVNGFFSNQTEQLEILGTFGGEQASLALNEQTTDFIVENNPVFGISDTGELSVNPFFGPFGLNATATASYTLNGTTLQDTFDIEAFFFGFDEIFGGDIDFPIEPTSDIDFVDESTDPDPEGFILARPDGSFRSVFADQMTITLLDPVSGVSAPANGNIVVGPNVPLNTRFDVQYTFVDNGPDGSGRTLTATIGFIVSNDPFFF